MRSLRSVLAAGMACGLTLAGPLPAGEDAKGGEDGLVFYGEADARASSMTSDKPEAPKAIQPHDLVTVKIKDVYSFLNNTKLNTSSKSETELAIDSFFKITSGKSGRGWDLTPSAEDKQTTRRLVQAGRIMGIPVADHLVLTERGYFSFRSAGLL